MEHLQAAHVPGGAVSQAQLAVHPARRILVARQRSLPVARVVGEAHLHLEPLARVRLDQRVGLRRRPRDVRLRAAVHAHPLVGEAGRQPVSVHDAGGGRRQGPAHLRRAGNLRLARGGGVGGGGGGFCQLQFDHVADRPTQARIVPIPVVHPLRLRILEGEGVGTDVKHQGPAAGGDVGRNPQPQLAVGAHLHRRHVVVGPVMGELVLREVGGIRATIARGTVRAATVPAPEALHRQGRAPHLRASRSRRDRRAARRVGVAGQRSLGIVLVVGERHHLHLDLLAHVRRGKDVGLRGLPRDVRLVRHAVRVHPHPLVGVGVARIAVFRIRLAVRVRDAACRRRQGPAHLRRAGDRRLARRRGVGGGPVSNNREYPGQAVVWLKIT